MGGILLEIIYSVINSICNWNYVLNIWVTINKISRNDSIMDTSSMAFDRIS